MSRFVYALALFLTPLSCFGARLLCPGGDAIDFDHPALSVVRGDGALRVTFPSPAGPRTIAASTADPELRIGVALAGARFGQPADCTVLVGLVHRVVTQESLLQGAEPVLDAAYGADTALVATLDDTHWTPINQLPHLVRAIVITDTSSGFDDLELTGYALPPPR